MLFGEIGGSDRVEKKLQARSRQRHQNAREYDVGQEMPALRDTRQTGDAAENNAEQNQASCVPPQQKRRRKKYDVNGRGFAGDE